MGNSERDKIGAELAKSLAKVEQQLQQFKDIIPSDVSREKVSIVSKSALKAYLIRAGLLHRTADLVGAAIVLFKKRKDVPAFILTRASLETFALYYYFIEKVKTAIDSGKVKELDDILMRILFGARNAKDEVEAINILTVIDKLNRDVDGLRSMYDDLSEIAHPNWMGTVGHYGKVVDSPFNLYFEPTFENVAKEDGRLPPEEGLDVILAILGDLIDMDKSAQDILSKFKTLHEQAYNDSSD